MIEGILLSLLAATTYGLLGVSYEVAAKRHYKIWDVISYMQLTGLVIGSVITAFLGLPFFNGRLLALGFFGAATFVGSIACYLMASRERDIGANWTIVNLSVILPILVSILWFHDTFTALKAVAIVCTILSIVIIGGGFEGAGSGENPLRWVKYIALAFFLNAWLPTLLRFVPEGYSALFTTYLYGIGFLLVQGYKLLLDRHWPTERGLIMVSMGAAATHWSGIMLTMAALAVMGRVSTEAGVVVYPITNGLVIPVGVLLGVWLLKEKILTRTKIGIALAVVALVFLSLG
jgi:drug/metabolite transporter (DMT)-like permease